MVLPPRGLTGQDMGLRQTEEPLLGEVGVGPALVIQPPTSASAFAAFPQDAAQAASDPAIEGEKLPPPMVLEVLEPATQRPVQRPEDLAQRVPICPLRLGANRGLELGGALLPGPVSRA